MTQRIPRSSGRGAAKAAVGVLTLAVFFLSLTGHARPIENENIPLVTKGDFRPVLVLTGSLMALRSEEFKVPITQTWRLQIKWMVKEGDSVKPGASVVRFDPPNLAAELAHTQEAVRTKREEKSQKEADYRHQKF